MKNKVMISFLVLLSAFVVGGSGKAYGFQGGGRNIVVDDDRRQCRNADFTTIQQAVDAANPGDTISVCQGTYVEQVTIPSSKDGISLRSQQPRRAVIEAPDVMTDPKAIIHVAGAENVSIQRFTITGPGGGSCDSLRYGILVDGGGSAVIRENLITDIRDDPFGGCQNGVGVQVGSFINSTPSPGAAEIERNTIVRYQKNGITVNEAGSSAQVKENEITGFGATSVNAQNGIQIGFGADAFVERNTVSRNGPFTPSVGPDEIVAVGILLIEPGDVTLDRNGVFNNEDGIALFNTSTARLERNESVANARDGIFASSDSTNNTIVRNRMQGNGDFDAEDESSCGFGTAGTCNFWDNNNCQTDNPDGLCGGGPGQGNNRRAATRKAQPNR